MLEITFLDTNWPLYAMILEKSRELGGSYVKRKKIIY